MSTISSPLLRARWSCGFIYGMHRSSTSTLLQGEKEPACLLKFAVCAISMLSLLALTQVEGAFVFGLGMMLQESVTYNDDGLPTYDSTWDYKIPTAACIPRRFNIGLLAASALFLHSSLHALCCLFSCCVCDLKPTERSISLPLTRLFM